MTSSRTIKTYRYEVRGVTHALHTIHRLVRAKSIVSKRLHDQGHGLEDIREACRTLRLDDSGLRR